MSSFPISPTADNTNMDQTTSHHSEQLITSPLNDPLGIDKVYGPSFNEWVTGPWLVAITQEVYQQYNPALPTPWGM